ncbi:hypothetical protein HQ529_00935, partial [Candidatus Woesearchaeota archaeon]|nr:hypothetical protein [Candidatus Woesearchaeota archaeon]
MLYHCDNINKGVSEITLDGEILSLLRRPHLREYPVKAFEGKLKSAYGNQDVFDYTH